jgi:hypothetical protein
MSDMLDVAPSLPRYEPEGEATLLQGREPSRGEFLGASVSAGWWGTTVGQLGAQNEAARAGVENPAPLTREEWEASGLARPRLQWQEGMTRGRAEAMARIADDRAYREALMSARDPGALDMVLGFGGQMVGAIADPVNFVPIAGPLARGLRGVGAARAASVLAAPGVGASALRGVVDAVGGNVLAAPLVYASQQQFGEEITFDKVVMDLAVGAALGAGFGTVGGLLSRRLQPDAMASVRVLDAAARDIAAGRPAEVPTQLMRAAVEDAAMRAAPVDLKGVRLADLPMAPAGLPVSRAEFEAWAAERGTPVAANLRRDLLGGVARVEIGPDGRPQAIEPGPAFDPDIPREIEPPPPTRAEVVRAPVLGDDGQPLIAFSRDEARAIEARLTRNGEQEIEWVRIEGEPGSYAVATVAGADAYRGKDGAVRVYPSASRAKTAAGQIKGGGWVPLEVDGGFVLVRASGNMGQRLQANRQLVEIGGDFLAPPRAPDAPPPDPAIALADLIKADAYSWYREALAARQHMDRLAAVPGGAETGVNSPETRENLRENGGTSRAADGADPDLDAALRQIEALRAEGRLSPGDDAILRAGADQADELNAVADGLEEAGACLLRNLT